MSNRIFVATRKGLFTISKDDGQWRITRAHFLGDNLSIVLPDIREDKVYAALGHGHFGVKLHRSHDGGETWEECSTPAFPDLKEEWLDQWGKPVPKSVQLIWALETGLADQPGLLWCGTIPGGLFQSRDGGTSWEFIKSLWDQPERKKWFGGGADYPGIHSVCVHPKNSNHVTVGVSCGGVWLTEDGGESWNCRSNGMWAAYVPPDQKEDPAIQDPHIIVQCRQEPEYYWAQHHNGIFGSSDGLKSWSEAKDVAPSSFGFAAAVHPADGKTAWFIPGISDEHRIPVSGQLVVTRTRDGGETFEILRNGLPQDHAYDLVFRHGLAVDETGDTLVFGTTTGSLWISEDQGDSWQPISHHLPPVYCVRFAKAKS